MRVKWLIAGYGSEDRRKKQTRLCYAAQEAGAEAEVIPYDDLLNSIYERSTEQACIYVDGPIMLTLRVPRTRPFWIPGSWHDPEQYRCMSYYANWGKYITQQHYAFMPVRELRRRAEWVYEEFGGDKRQVFIRPDYGEKSFTGKVIAEENFKKWWAFDDIEQLDPKTCVVVSPCKNLTREYRLVISDSKVVTGSSYYMDGHHIEENLNLQDDRDLIIEFAEKVASDEPPNLPPVYVMDIAKEVEDSEVRYSVLEVGCAAAAGFYEADYVAIAKAITEQAEKEYYSYQYMAD